MRKSRKVAFYATEQDFDLLIDAVCYSIRMDRNKEILLEIHNKLWAVRAQYFPG